MKRASPLLAILVWTALAPGDASAEEKVPRIEVVPGATTVGLGEVFNVFVRIQTEDVAATSITLPDFDGFEVISKSVSNPVQFSFGFGTGGGGLKATHTREYDLWLRSTKPGKFTIDAVSVKWQGKTYEGRPFTITVTNQPAKQTTVPQPASPFPDIDWPFKVPGYPQPVPTPVPAPQPPAPADGAATDDVPVVLPQDLEGAKYDSEMFLQTVVEPREVSIGEQVTLTLLLYSSVNLGTIDIPTEPGTDKFWVKDLLPPAAKINFQTRMVNGQSFEVGVLRKVALFPTEAGNHTISPAVVTSASPFSGLFGGGNYTREGVPVEVVVHPLPAEGQPPGFVPSSVGAFSMTGTLVPEQTVASQPVTFTVTLTGTGNIEMLAAPKMTLPDHVKAYEPQVTDLVSLKGGIVGGTKKIEYMMLPTQPGKLTVGPLEWSFYNPGKGAYETLRVDAKVLDVLPAGPTPTEDVTQAVVPEDDGERYMPIHTVAALRRTREQVVRTPWFLAAVIVPPGLLAVVCLFAAGRSLTRGMRSRNPAGAALKEARAMLRKAGDSGDHGRFYAEVQRAIYLYLEKRFSVPATGMTGPELIEALLRLGVDHDLADQVVKETENCEFARYGRSSSDRDLDMSGIRSRVVQVLELLEKVEPPRRKEEKT